MMTGTANNGRCNPKMLDEHSKKAGRPVEAGRMGEEMCRQFLTEGGNLRNTARGASSPAKPALHIPELDYC